VKGEEFKDDYRKALPKEVVSRLTRRSAWRASAAVLHDFAVLALAIGAGLYFWPNPLVLLACVLIIGTRQHALFVIAHDAAHYLLYENRLLNEIVGRTCAMLQGLSMCTYRVIHRLHHNNLYGVLDPDTALHGGYPRGRAYLIKKLLKDLSGLTAWKTEARHDRNAVIAFHLLALVLFAVSGYLIEYLVLWVLPLVTVVQAILRLRAIAEHGATTDFSSPLTAARTNVAPAWLEWLIFPHQVNYHIEHHLYASVPHYNLPALHAEMVKRGVLEGAEVVPFRITLGKIFADRYLGKAT
jgi:fatty acid desaturase